MKPNVKPEEPKTIRCAIYTRKSTDEGLEQEFNTLDAQRESAEAYILSQKHDGWVALSKQYNDGGFTGANIERPAVKELLSDIEAGKIDCVVVYKVDRLSRSLLDFARFMELFERHNVSFVSVTQQFSTTNSMGRLTLNILLSFAQFERELIAERTKDKMSAARKKGKWTGGIPVLGYDIAPEGGKLIVNEEEAEMVRQIFDIYLEQQSLLSTVKELNRLGWTTKKWTTKKGKEHKGKPFNKNNLASMLTNIIYTGKVQHHGEVYPGEHEAIISEEVWQNVQKVRLRNGNGNGNSPIRYTSLLKGLLFCEACNTTMNHNFTKKGQNKRYRYYVCQKAQKMGWDTCPAKSIPAPEIEKFVIDRIHCIGQDNNMVSLILEKAGTQNQKQIEKLQTNQKIAEQKLKRYNDQMKSLISHMGNKKDSELPTKLADLQDAILETEKQLTSIRDEMIFIKSNQLEKDELINTLSFFDPIWNTLSLREQARIIHLLVEKVSYDGRDETVAITFRPTGIKSLAKEVGNYI